MIFNASNAPLIRSESYSLHDGSIDNFQYHLTELSIEMIVSTTIDNPDKSDTAKLRFDKVHYCSINNAHICSADCRNELNGWGRIDCASIPDFSACKFVSADPPLAVEFEFVDGSKIIVVCDTIRFDRI